MSARSTKSTPRSRKACTGPGTSTRARSEHLADVAAGEVGVLLRAGERELLADDPPVEQEPGVAVTGARHVLQRAEAVEARDTAAAAAGGRSRPARAVRARTGSGCRADPRPASG